MKACLLSGSKHFIGKMSAENVMVAPCSTLWHASVVVSWVPVHLKAEVGSVCVSCESKKNATCSKW